MLFYRDKYIAKLYWGSTRIKEIWLGNKKLYGPQTKKLLSGTEDFPVEYYLENFCIKTTQGEIIADDVQTAVASYRNSGSYYSSFIFYIRNGALHSHSTKLFPSPDVLGRYVQHFAENYGEGWSNIVDVGCSGSGKSIKGHCLGVKERKACLLIDGANEEIMSRENVVKVQSVSQAWMFDNFSSVALTYDGTVLLYCPDTTGKREWVKYRQGAVDILDKNYLNTNNEWRDIVTDELVKSTME